MLHDVITLIASPTQNLTPEHYYFRHLFPICTICIPSQNINQPAD